MRLVDLVLDAHREAHERAADLNCVHVERLSFVGENASSPRIAPDAARIAKEAVVDDLEKETRRMVEFLGLPSVEVVLRFHETEQPVRTASVSQVREPIYRTSAGRWHKKSTHLQPLLGCSSRYDPIRSALLDQHSPAAARCNARSWRNTRLRPKTAFSCFAPVRRADLEGQQRVA